MVVALVILSIGIASLIAGVIMYFVWNIKGISDELSGKSSRKRVERLKRVNSGNPGEMSTTTSDLYHDIHGVIDGLDQESGSGSLHVQEDPVTWRNTHEPTQVASVPERVATPTKAAHAAKEPVSVGDVRDPFGASTRFNVKQKLTSLSKE